MFELDKIILESAVHLMAVMAYQPNINQEMRVLKIVNHHHFFATLFSPNPLPVKEKITGKWQKGADTRYVEFVRNREP